MLQLFGTQQMTLQKHFKSLHRRAIKVVLKRTSLTDKDYKVAQILPLSSRLTSNKARFVHTILSGRAPMYLSTKLLINQSSGNSSRKLNVPIPRIDLFKSSLVYSGPVLWNSVPSELSFQSVLQCLKSILCFIYYLSWVLRETMIIYIYIYLSMCCSNLCCAASGSPYILCVCALCACNFR